MAVKRGGRIVKLTCIRHMVVLSGILLSVQSRLSAQDDTVVSDIDTSFQISPLVNEQDSSVEKYFYKRWDTLSVEERTIPSDIRKKIAEEDELWYANSDLKKTKQEVLEERRRGKNGQRDKNDVAIRERGIAAQPWFQTLLWVIIVAGFGVFLAIYLSSSQVGLFRKKIRSTGLTDDETIPEDIFAINYQREIDKAKQSGNFRLAIRLHFLQLLRKLSETNTIHYRQDKTNFDYLLELQPTRHYNNFFRVARNYEYSWYGQFPVSRDAYTIIERDFEQLKDQLN